MGPKLAKLLEIKGIRTVQDAIFFLPRDYQDRSQIKSVSNLKPNETALLCGRVIRHSFIPIRSLRRPLLEAKVQDKTGVISLKWFHYNRNYFESKLTQRPLVLVYGNVKAYRYQLEITHPEIEWDVDIEDLASSQGIYPIYSETEGLHQKALRKIIAQAVQCSVDQLVDEIPASILTRNSLIQIHTAVQRLHCPPKETSIESLRTFKTTEHRRLIFDEFFKFEWIVGRKRLNLKSEQTKAYVESTTLFENFLKKIPFELTEDQYSVIYKIYEDLRQTKPMSRLLQGDVGCGKTLVAFAATLPVASGGGQAALMVPTEILAEQHYLYAKKYLEGLSLSLRATLTVDLLVGSTPKSKRDEILEKLKAGLIQVLIGTHALLEDSVQFKEMGLAIIDEQHRFGVDQRMRLRAKGDHPHVLSLTATPIPRTLALTAYGDLDVSTIRQMPKGRQEIYTEVFSEKNRQKAMQILKAELKKSRQAYIVYPLVEESEKIDLANAVAGAKELETGELKDFKVGLLHGRMKSSEKNFVMNAFKQGEIHALVSTTVVEVGVDVPNATVLLIEHAERFGLSQLHQLRGRIGRGAYTSYCLLMSTGGALPAYERLKAMQETRDGFKLAELDLQIRGPGEFLGTKQSGELQFQYANLLRDQELLQSARVAAFDILKSDSELIQSENKPLRIYMERIGQLQQKRFETA